MIPYLANQPPWFTFLVHPRDLDDITLSGPGRFLRGYCKDDRELRGKLVTMPPTIVGEVRMGFQANRGELVGIWRFLDTLPGTQAFEAVLEAALVAASRGAKVIGLGALTSPLTGGGSKLLRRLPRGVTVTTGNAYTAAVVRHNVVEAADFLGLGRRARVAVLGCTGSVGTPASRMLAEHGFRMHLIGRTARRAQRVLASFERDCTFHGSLEGLKRADIVVVLTSDPSARIQPRHLARDALVIDCTQPPNIPESALPAFAARGVRVVAGGLVEIPDYSCSYDFRLPNPRAAFACLAETLLFAQEGIRDHSTGRPPVELASRLERIAARHGISPCSLALQGSERAAEVPMRAIF